MAAVTALAVLRRLLGMPPSSISSHRGSLLLSLMALLPRVVWSHGSGDCSFQGVDACRQCFHPCQIVPVRVLAVEDRLLSGPHDFLKYRRDDLDVS